MHGDSFEGEKTLSKSCIAGVNVLRGRDDYSIWKFKMRMYLMHEDLIKCIEGYPEDDTTSPAVKISKERKVFSSICLTLDGSAITQVRKAVNAKEVWEALQAAYEDKSMGRRLSLERKLYRISLQDFDGNLEKYINVIMSTAQDLADIGKVIEDSSIAAILLGGLSTKYDPLVMTIENSNIEVTSEKQIVT